MTKALSFCVEMPPLTQARGGSGSTGSQSRLWPPGTVLYLSFLDGTRARQDEVAQAAYEWTSYANLRFVVSDKLGAQIRVTFATAGVWSYIGTDALAVPPDRPTVGLGTVDKRSLRGAALHVFGHVLGFVHEHQNPSSGVPWDKQKLYAYLADTCGWTAQQVDTYIIARYGVSTANHTFFDPTSIMLMPVPPELTHGSFAIPWNTALAETDKSYAAQCYPLSDAALSPAYSINIQGDMYQIGSITGDSITVGRVQENVEAAEPGGSNTGVGLAALGIPQGLVEEKIRLDVATPQAVVLDEPFDLAVAVVRPGAPPLVIDDLPAVSSEEGTVYRPGAEAVIRYRIGVTGANCDVSPPSYTILLRPGEDSKPRYFQVTPHKPGKCTLVVNAYQEDDVLAAQTRVRIEVQVPVRSGPDIADPKPPQDPADSTGDLVLTPPEIWQFKEALRSAFQRPELEQVVFFGLEVRLDDIVAHGTYDKEVTDLAIWANDKNKVAALLEQARRVNPGSVQLRDFEAYLKTRQP